MNKEHKDYMATLIGLGCVSCLTLYLLILLTLWFISWLF